jgi:hypothetical protein
MSREAAIAVTNKSEEKVRLGCPGRNSENDFQNINSIP